MSNVLFPLSQREKSQLKEIENAFACNKIIGIADDEESRLLDMLRLLVSRGIIQPMEMDNTNAYRLTGTFKEFWNWVDDQEKKSRKLSRKEWVQCLLSGLGGVVLTLLLQYVIPLIRTIFINAG